LIGTSSRQPAPPPTEGSSMDLELTGKRALVTGGSRGIGKAIARELALEGADVAIAARDQDRIDATVAELASASGRRVIGTSADTGDGESVAAMVAASAEALGGIDILVNAAAQPGGQQPAPRWDGVTEEGPFGEIRVRVLGSLRVAQAVAPYMMASRWGRIINVSGLAARQTGSAIGSAPHAARSRTSDEPAQ